MCGIGYAITFDGSPVNDTILARYKNQRTRGIEGFGIYDRAEDNIIKTPKEDKFVNWLRHYKSNDILFHHRTPTSAPNVKNACHPFSTGDHFDKNYILVHNGWINNAETLANEHDAYKINYTSLQANLEFNDSESLVWDFALWRQGLIPAMKSVGAIAFICIVKGENEDKLYFYRNNNPLKAIINYEGITLSSEGEGQTVPEDTLFCYDYNTRLLTFENLELPTYVATTYEGQRGLYAGMGNDYSSYPDSYIDWTKNTKFNNQTSLVNDYKYPLLKKEVETLWPRAEGMALYSLKYVKAVTKYLNRKLYDTKEFYEDTYESIDKDIQVYEKLLAYKDHTMKTVMKYNQQLKIATIARDVLFSLPNWADEEDLSFSDNDYAEEEAINEEN